MDRKMRYATRLSLYVISLAALIFSLTMVVYYEFAKQKITEKAINKTDMMIGDMVNKITTQLVGVETTIRNVAWMIEEDELRGDSINSILKSIIAHNSFISGSAIAYVPGYLKGESEKMLYASRSNGFIYCKKIENTNYNYLNAEWFSIPVKNVEPYWSEPYFDSGAGDAFMCTYSVPVLDAEGSVVAVITADISLNEFKENIQRLKPHEQCVSYFLSRKNRYITDSSSDSLKSNAISKEITSYKSQLSMKEISSRLDKAENFYSERFDAYVFYAAIPCTGWSIWSIYPRAAMTDQAYAPLYNIVLIAILGLVLMFLVIYFAIKRLVAPLTQFATSAKQIAKGKFNVELPIIKSEDEMADLRQAFEYMQKNLATYVEELRQTTAIKEKIENELSIARDIQMGMLPRNIVSLKEKYHVDLCALLKPMKEIGGDLYDFFMIGDKLFVFIGDVSGKGVPAALFMATTRSLLRAVMTTDLTAEKTIERINSVIGSVNNQGMFVTCFFAILDTQTGEMEFCNAGHNPPVIIHPNGDVQFMDLETNIAVGVLDEYSYVGQSITITQGTKIVLYTDGIVEAEDNHRNLYSDERLLDVLDKNKATNSADMIKVVEQSVIEYSDGAQQSDDIAILVLEYKPVK